MRIWRRLALVAALSMVPALLHARVFEIRKIEAAEAQRLTPEALKAYEEGLVAVDKINYPYALDLFIDATKHEPDNDHLNFIVVQTAHYLGDTRPQSKTNPQMRNAGEYYDVAIKHLKTLAASPRLNAHERQRADRAIEMMSELRDKVGEREQKRHQYGEEIAKTYAQITLKESEKVKAMKGRVGVTAAVGGAADATDGGDSVLESYSEVTGSAHVGQMGAIREGVYNAQ